MKATEKNNSFIVGSLGKQTQRIRFRVGFQIFLRIWKMSKLHL